MNQNRDMREHPLFKNRTRLLAIPAKTNLETLKEQRKHKLIFLNLLLAFAIFGAFVAGVSSQSPQYGTTLLHLPGQYWQTFMQGQFGGVSGKGLAEKSPWIIARVGGILAYLLLFSSVVLGLCVSLHLTDRFMHPSSVVYLHRLLALTTLIFTAIHIIGLLLDRYVKISWLQSLTPFSTSYRPVWTGLGTLSFYGIIALIISFYLAARFGYKLWRTIHYLSFGIFSATLLHGMMAGTDTTNGWMLPVYLLTGLVVAILLVLRFASKPVELTQPAQ